MAVPDPVPLPDAGTVRADAGAVPVDPCEPNPCTAQRQTQCEAVDGTAVCSCDEGTLAIGDVCLPVTACEDGDGVGCALVLTRGAAVDGTLNQNGGDNSDWYRLEQPSTGGIERITIHLIGDSGPDAVRQGGETIPVVPNIKFFVAPELETAARIVPRDGIQDDGQFVRILSAEVAPGAVVLVRIDDADEQAINYRIEATATATDDHADGDDGATQGSEGETEFVLETREDTDTINIEIDRVGALLASVSLNELSETTAAISLRIGSLGGNDHRRYYGRARHEVSRPGTYSIRVDHRDQRLVSGTLYLRVLSDDDHGDRAEEASPISAGLGEIVQGSLEAQGADWFAFAAQANQVYRVIYNGSGTLQGRRADDTGFVWNYEGGDHYRHDGQSSDVVLEVSGEAHDYDLMIMTTDINDTAGNRLGAAELLADGAGPFTGTLDYRGDADFYGPIFGEGSGCIGWPDQGLGRLEISALDDQGRVLATAPMQDGQTQASLSEPAVFYLRVGVRAGQTVTYPFDYQFSYNSEACN